MVRPKSMARHTFTGRVPKGGSKTVFVSGGVPGQCWCGKKSGHSWPGQKKGKPHPR